MVWSGADNGRDVALIPRTATHKPSKMDDFHNQSLSLFSRDRRLILVYFNSLIFINTSPAMPVIMLGLNWINCDSHSKLITQIPHWYLPDACNIPPTIFHRFAMVKWTLFRNSIVLFSMCDSTPDASTGWRERGEAAKWMECWCLYSNRFSWSAVRMLSYPYKLQLWFSLQV